MPHTTTFPPDAPRRLAVLRGYGLLNTPPEEALDELTTLAATICEVPIALISLVDERRQWFKAKVGLVVPETPCEVSFCEHSLGQQELLIVPDAQEAQFAELKAMKIEAILSKPYQADALLRAIHRLLHPAGGRTRAD